MMILLEKSRSDGVLESLTVPRLLNMAAEYDQVHFCISKDMIWIYMNKRDYSIYTTTHYQVKE